MCPSQPSAGITTKVTYEVENDRISLDTKFLSHIKDYLKIYFIFTLPNRKPKPKGAPFLRMNGSAHWVRRESSYLDHIANVLNDMPVVLLGF